MKSAGFQFELLYAAVAFLLLLNRQCEKKKKSGKAPFSTEF